MNRSVLVVDDDPHLREVIAMALNDAGYRVRQATDGMNALREIEKAAPDLVLSDIRMPLLDGFGLMERLARRQVLVPVILMSAASSVPPGTAASFIPKPFDLDDLLDRVDDVLRKQGRARSANGAAPRGSSRRTGGIGRQSPPPHTC
jgi:two-component system OmpR family response regulator